MNRKAQASLKKALKACEEGRLGATTSSPVQCFYRLGEKRCVVGSMLPEPLLDKIETQEKNNDAIFDMSRSLRKAITDTTGLNLKQLRELQNAHDCAYSERMGSPQKVGRFAENLKLAIAGDASVFDGLFALKGTK